MNTGTNFIEHLTWEVVARRIAGGTAAILPIGAAAKQHGFHLPVNTDRIPAEALAGRLAQRIHADLADAHIRALSGLHRICGQYQSLGRHIRSHGAEIATGILAQGCRALFVLDTGLSTIAPVAHALAGLDPALHLRIHEGTLYHEAARRLATQNQGSHADELETSLMLALAPELVDMARAEASPAATSMTPGLLTPIDTTSPNYSRSGSYGDPTLATREKGEILLAAMIDDIGEQAATFLASSTGASESAQSVSR